MADVKGRAESAVKNVIESLGYELVEVTYKKEYGTPTLTFFIDVDREGGIGLDDCETVSRAFSDKLDEVDPIPDAYILEVSSPGLGRTLKKDRHLEKSIGQEVEVKLFKAVSEKDKRKEFDGILVGFDEKTITIREGADEENPDGGVEFKFERSNVALIRLALDF